MLRDNHGSLVVRSFHCLNRRVLCCAQGQSWFTCVAFLSVPYWEYAVLRDNAKVTTEVESVSGQVKQAQSVVPPMERLVQGLEKQQADTLKYARSIYPAACLWTLF